MAISYRKIAFDTYPNICAYCGFGIIGILQVAHLSHDRKDDSPENLVILCPTCHKMYDGNLISKDALIVLRDTPRKLDWSVMMKDAGVKAANKRKHRAAGRKAAITRLKNLQAKVTK
jgi:hypothetical protein